MSDEPEFRFAEPGEYTVSSPTIISLSSSFKPNYNIQLSNESGVVGMLDFNGPELKFTGKADEAAMVFIDWIAKQFASRLEQERKPQPEAGRRLPGAIWLACWFHDTYESLAPLYGYETKPETRVFDATTPNGKLMIAVCEKLHDALHPPQEQR